MKYDCNKTKDYIHELRRMCASMSNCEICVLYALTWTAEDACSIAGMNDELIERIQKWSDEHPESVKLTKEDRIFVDAFLRGETKGIRRRNGRLYLVNLYGDVEFEIRKDMFLMIGDGEHELLENLAKLELEDA